MKRGERKTSRNVLTAVFKRKGSGGTYTKIFEEFHEQEQNRILEKVVLGHEEAPVVAVNPSDKRWVLVTTDRIIWLAEGRTRSIHTSELAEVIPLKFATAKKSELRDLKLRTFRGDEHVLQLEEGAPFSGIWNVLKFLANRNQKKQKG